jgi:excisionase family DNA binding protein
MSPAKETGSIFNRDAARGGAPGMNGKAPAMSAPVKRYYRIDEVARYFQVSDRTIYRLIDMGDIKAIRLRECLRVSTEEIREFEERAMIDLGR